MRDGPEEGDTPAVPGALIRPDGVGPPSPAGGRREGAPATLKPAIVARARALGFDIVRVAAPDAIPLAPERLRRFLEAGMAGTMAWLAETEPRRADPRVLWPEVRAIVMLAMNYGPATDPMLHLADKGAANVSVYARGRDYHDVLKGRLKEVAQGMESLGRRQGLASTSKVFVDTAPVMEKPLAEAAGLGWQGKHTNLVSREYGSWLFLGSIFTSLPLEPDAAEADHCGSCRACLDVCPTRAFPAPYRLDPRRCISYLTIEHEGPIPHEFRRAIGNRVYGCDDCLAVCPWNKYAREASEAKLAARPDLAAPRLADWLGLDEAGFRALFAGSAVKRLGHSRFLRNVLVAAGNAGDASLRPAVARHAASADAVVREAAEWASRELPP